MKQIKINDIVYNNKEEAFKAFKEIGISPYYLKRLINEKGVEHYNTSGNIIELEVDLDNIEKELKFPKKPVEYNGVVYESIDALCKHFNMSKKTYYARNAAGIPLDKPLVGKPVDREDLFKEKFEGRIHEERVNGRIHVFYDGVEYKSRVAFCTAFNVPVSQMTSWISRGRIPSESKVKVVKAPLDAKIIDNAGIYQNDIDKTKYLISKIKELVSLPKEEQQAFAEKLIAEIDKPEKKIYCLNFDLDTKKTKAYYGDKHYNNAYYDIGEYLTSRNFASPQGSVYIANKPVRDDEVHLFLNEMKINLSWLPECLNDIKISEAPKDAKIFMKNMNNKTLKEQKDFFRDLNKETSKIALAASIKDVYSMSDWKNKIKSEQTKEENKDVNNEIVQMKERFKR